MDPALITPILATLSTLTSFNECVFVECYCRTCTGPFLVYNVAIKAIMHHVKLDRSIIIMWNASI